MPRKPSRPLLAAFLLLAAASSRAADERHTFELGAGGTFSNMMKTTKSDDSSSSFLGTVQPVVSLGIDLGWVYPEIDYTPIARTGADDAYKSRSLVLSLPALFRGDVFDFRFGPTAWIQTIAGEGGTITLGNGTSTAVFDKPDRSEKTRTLGLMGGAHAALGSSLGLDIELHLLAPLTTRRAINSVVQLTWGIL